MEKQVWALDGNQAVSFLLPMTDLASESLSTERVLSILIEAGFAGLALLMAAVGIYAVVSFRRDATHAGDRRQDGIRC